MSVCPLVQKDPITFGWTTEQVCVSARWLQEQTLAEDSRLSLAQMSRGGDTLTGITVPA